MLQSFFDKLRPHFEEGGKLHAFHSVFEGMETFVLVPNTTAKVGVSIHDAIDSKRIMTFVIIALLPALFFGMYNIGYQTYMTPPAVVGASFWEMFAYGFLIMLPKIVVSYAVGLGIEFAVAQYKHEEINEGYLVTGLLIPMIVPIELPLWMLAVAVAFSVIFAKEIFGGTGMNFFNPALVARAFLFFSKKHKKNMKVAYYTEEGLRALKAELDQLRDVERPRASQAIAEARDKGDLSENAEYDAAKEAQGLLELKIAKLEELVASARVIDESQLDTSKVLILSTVKLKNKANNAVMTYTLVAESEADLKSGKISVSSPIGRGLLGKSVGDIAEIKVPNGTLQMEIIEITR